jgi:hypothetical protein
VLEYTVDFIWKGHLNAKLVELKLGTIIVEYSVIETAANATGLIMSGQYFINNQSRHLGRLHRDSIIPS